MPLYRADPPDGAASDAMNSASLDNEALSGALEGSLACSDTDVSRDIGNVRHKREPALSRWPAAA
jgi:hypothetical protein